MNRVGMADPSHVIRSWPPSTRRAAASLTLVIAGILAYSNALDGPFLFDDVPAIVDNGDIRQILPLWRSPTESDRTSINSRPLVRLSLALNYAADGLDVRGYHALNIVIHGACALLMMGLLRRALAGPQVRCASGRAAGFAFAAAVLWLVHPVNSQVVDYVVQRSESLVAACYLLTLYGLTRGATGGRLWYAVSVSACLAGMMAKEVMVTAPVMALLWDRTFLSEGLRLSLARRPAYYTCLASTCLLLVGLLWSRPHGGSIGVGSGVGPVVYALNQAESVVTYLRLLIWPSPLVLDYGFARGLAVVEVLPELLCIASLLVATGWALIRHPAFGLAGAWFFIILAPTSSVIPLVGEVAAERRVYLSAMAPVTLTVIVTWWALRSVVWRWAGPAVLLVCAVVLIAATRARNEQFRGVEVWQVAVKARPHNPRGHTSLGVALAAGDRWREAELHFRRALELRPGFAEAHYNLGNAWMQVGGLDSAVTQYRAAIAAEAEDAQAHANLAAALRGLGDVAGAQRHGRLAVGHNPRLPVGHTNLAIALQDLGRFDEAIQHFQEAVRLDPDNPVALHNLAAALQASGDLEGAESHYRAALLLRPDLVSARRGLNDLLPEGSME